MLKYGLLALGIILLGFAIWPMATSAMGDRPNEATRLVESTERTSSNAESLNSAFSDVIPPSNGGRNVPPPSQYPAPPQPYRQPGEYGEGGYGQGYGDGGHGPAAGMGPEGNVQAGQGLTPTPTPDPYAHSSEHAVQEAMEFLNRMQTEFEVPQTEYVLAVNQLKAAWAPRYQSAVAEYKLFAKRIDHADRMANEYFNVQRSLTAQYTNPAKRRKAELNDLQEYEVYRDWRDQAHKTQSQAYFIMTKLHDMNLDIAKLQLSSHFAAIYQDFQTMPPEITMLHEELAEFQRESDNIRTRFGFTDVEEDE